MTTLNRDCIAHVLSYLSLRDAVRCTLMCQATSSLYNDDEFWRRFCITRYHLDPKHPSIRRPPGTNYLGLAIIVETIYMNTIKTRRFLPARTFSILFSIPTKERENTIKEMLAGWIPSNSSCDSLNSVLAFNKDLGYIRAAIPGNPQLNLEPCSPMDCSFMLLGTAKSMISTSIANNLRKIFRFILVPTVYLTDRGPITLPIDIDRCYYLDPQCQAVGDAFYRMMSIHLWNHIHHICLAHLE